MKRFLLTALLVFSLCGSSLAGDIPSVPGPPPPPDDVTITTSFGDTVDPGAVSTDDQHLPDSALSFLSMLLGLIV